MIHAIQHLKMAADDYRRMSTPNANTITEYTANKNAELADEFELAAEALSVPWSDGLCVTLEKNMDLSEKEWDDAKQFGQYMLEQGEDESEAVVEFRRQDLAAYLGVLGFCHKGSDDAQLDAAKSAAAIAWGWLWHVTTEDDRVKTARQLLGQMLDKDLKRYGIQTAKAEGARVNVQEIEAATLRGEFGDA